MLQVYSQVIRLYTYIIYIYILFHILFHHRLSQNINYVSLCYTIGPCCLSILYIIVCVNPKLLIYPSPYQNVNLTGCLFLLNLTLLPPYRSLLGMGNEDSPLLLHGVHEIEVEPLSWPKSLWLAELASFNLDTIQVAVMSLQ